jgi:Tfp pilus assembly protein PilV
MTDSVHSSGRQKGVTLIEVLVGFVIFTTSLVAVLNYVSEQIYHNQRATMNLQKMQTIYEWSRIQPLGLDESRALSPRADDFSLMVAASTIDAFTQNETETLLNSYSYSVADQDNALTWDVLRVE